MGSGKEIRRPDSPLDGPKDGVIMNTDCIRTDFLEREEEREAIFQQREKSTAHISASEEMGIFSIRDMQSGIMLTISYIDAMEVMRASIDAAKEVRPCKETT